MEGEFKFDGTAFRCGRFIFPVKETVFVEGLNVPIPLKYAVMMLKGDRDAWRFAERVAGSPILDRIKKCLLEMASHGAMEAAEKLLDEYLREAPRGKPRFYRLFRSEDGSEKPFVYLNITDGEKCYEINISYAIWDAVNDLPVNVYVEPTRIPSIYVDREDLLKAVLSKPEKMFTMLGKLANVAGEYDAARVQQVFEDFVKRDEETSLRILERMVKQVERRRRIREVVGLLEKERVLKCAGGGYVVAASLFYIDDYFFVSDDARVFQIKYNRNDAREYAIYRLVKGVKGSRIRLVEADPNDEYWRKKLQKVAAILGKVRPDIAPIILP